MCSNHPRISLVATVRNEGRSIRAFIESLLAQERKPEEIIIVDGQSQDGTAEILREYEQVGLIRVISRNCNIAEGRNIGIAAARNDLIAVTDAGCLVAPNWLLHISRCFSDSDSPDVVSGNYDFESLTPFEEASVYATDSPGREASGLAKYFPSSRSIAFRKKAWALAKGYPEWLYAGEDTLFNVRLHQLGLKFRFSWEAKVRWRPRQTWKGLWKQYFNYGRGNGRTGFGISGYVVNVQSHVAAAVLLSAGFVWLPFALLGIAAFAQHVRRNLWSQAKAAGLSSGKSSMRWRVLLVMEVVRLAGMVGFIAGRLDRMLDPSLAERQREWMGTDSVEEIRLVPNVAHAAMLVAIPLQTILAIWIWGWMVIVPAFAVTVVLTLKSVRDFSRTGPQLKEEILRYYSPYSLFALGRLAFWVFVLCIAMAGTGLLVLEGINAALHVADRPALPWLAGIGGIAVITMLQFLRQLLLIPASIAASLNYRLSRFYKLWRALSPRLLATLTWTAVAIFFAAIGAQAWTLASQAQWKELMLRALCIAAYLALMLGAIAFREPRAVKSTARPASDTERPNILMIGSDSLRADRLGVEGYHRPLTPALDELAGRGTYLSSCYVPCARTAPSLASLMSGNWPKKHGIRDNFTSPEEASSNIVYLPQVLRDAGYKTIAVSDWAGADLHKFPFGFETSDVPEDQWNIKYLLRQGPKDIRAFLTLFTHNRFGKKFLPELYYLASVPMTDELGRTARTWIGRCAQGDQPFLINVFFSTTHAPFGSEFPYYTLYSSRDYDGSSKFVMANLTEPFEIVERQRLTSEHFDLGQIKNLYDGCVKRFNDEVTRLISHLKACGLERNTIVVIYADHGVEFFERDTWGQGNSVVVDDSARIPVIIVDPRHPKRVNVKHTTRSIDIAPTLLELAGFSVPKTIEGVSLAPTLKGTGNAPDLPAFAETGIWFTRLPGFSEDHLMYPDLPDLLEIPDKVSGTLAVKDTFRELVVAAKDRMIRTDRWKLTYAPMRDADPKVQLFDLRIDPTCRNDVANTYPEVASDLHGRLRVWMQENIVSPTEGEAFRR